MPQTCGNGRHPTGQSYHLYRLGPDTEGAGHPVPDLTELVATPALEAPRSGHGAGMTGGNGDGGHAAGQAHDVHWRGASTVRAVAQLTGLVVTPALEAPRSGHGAGGGTACGDGGHAAGQAHDVHRRVAAGEAASLVSKLTGSVVPPALEAPRCGHGAGVGDPNR